MEYFARNRPDLDEIATLRGYGAGRIEHEFNDKILGYLVNDVVCTSLV